MTCVPEVVFDPLLEANEPELVQPLDLGGGEAAVGEVRKRWAAPELERVVRRSALTESLEAGEVELVGVDLEHVAWSARLQSLLAE